ncbi:MAG: response regulator transcription factor [Elusimicrobiota bacterium]|nr:response regulator transcription factor [Elusimicrobiota bacterium]
MIKIAMADDHIMVRNGIRAVLESKDKDIQVVAEVSNGKELLEFAKNNDADIYLMDISMPILNGIEATQKLIRMKPESKVIMLSMHDDRVSVEKAIKAGAKGFVVKVSDVDTIIKAIEEVISDRFFLCSKVSRYLVEGFLNKTSTKRPKGVLTPKEREVLQLIAEGYSSKKIAEEFGLSLNTVHVHRNNIMRKLKIHKQAELIRYAIKEGIAHI